MKYNIATITDYLEELTGNKTRRLAHAKGKDKKLPLTIATSYSFYDLEFMETQVTIAIPSGLDSITPMQLSKHQAKMIEAFNHPVIFALESVASYQVARLTQAKVDFIVPGKMVFIPSMLIVLRELKNTVKEMPEMMPPVAQLLMLYHLETRIIDGLTASEIAELTGSLLINHKTWGKYSNNSAIIRIFANKICERTYNSMPKERNKADGVDEKKGLKKTMDTNGTNFIYSKN